jgi:hypothetical protein
MLQTVTICDANKGKIIEKRVNGEKVSEFETQLDTAYQILSTFRFTQ